MEHVEHVYVHAVLHSIASTSPKLPKNTSPQIDLAS
jgi:hypothetical protein